MPFFKNYLFAVLISFSIPTLSVSTPTRVLNAWELPPLTLNDLNGKRHSLHEWNNNVIILNFWATWCGPCQIETPYLMKFQARYGASGLQVIGVGLDEKRKLANFSRTLGINYPILHADPNQESQLLRLWGNAMGTLPFTVIIDRNGTVIFSQSGIFDDEAFNTYVLPLLKGNRAASFPTSNGTNTR